jgi:hypothetical protein
MIISRGKNEPETKAIVGRDWSFCEAVRSQAISHMDPNDRRYDRKIEKMIRHIKPEELDRLMGGELEKTAQIDQV